AGLPGRPPVRLRRRRAPRGSAGHHPTDRGRSVTARVRAGDAARGGPSARRRRRPNRDHLRVRPGNESPARLAGRAPMNGVEIAGIGLHPFGRFEGKAVTEMAVHAVRDALADAGVGRGEFQAAFCGTAYGGVAAGHKVLDSMGMTGMPIVDVEAGCASGGAALMLAAGAIAAGQYDTVLVFGMEKMPKGIIRSSFFEPWREEAGLAATPAYFALRAQRLLREAGLSKQHLAEVVVKNRANGVNNPNAMLRKEATREQAPASRAVAEPLHLWMLCSPNEGAAAVVVRRGSGGVRVAATVLRSHLPGNVLSEATPMSGRVDDDVPAPTTLAATAAYEAAGIGATDVDVVECQDTDAARELLSYEE